MQNTQVRSRAGWAPEETELMWSAVQQAGSAGQTLKSAFTYVAEKTGRKPDSIRNYYYQSLREEDAPEELRAMRAQPFIPFAEEDVNALLREILSARAEGVSVRACVQRMGNGDRALALRYQNKYRSILKNRPDWIEQTVLQLREEGINCPNPYDTMRSNAPRTKGGEPSSADAESLLQAMRDMLARQEREESVRHREELDRMSVRCDLLRLELARRDEMLVKAQEYEQQAESVLRKVSGLMESCQELLSSQEIEAARNLVNQAMKEIGAVE